MGKITRDALKAVVTYNPETGQFFWMPRNIDGPKVSSWNTRYAGRLAGVRTHGYVRLSILGEKHYAHRLAFLYMTGRWPNGLIDHINGNGEDNRWSNLREATKVTNAANPNNRKRSNKTGHTGVVMLSPGRFMAQCGALRRLGKPAYIGVFPTAEEAGAAYLRCKKAMQA